MTILLTNDDGYNYEGIRVLKRCLEKYARVIIVAPEEVMSAKSTSITIGEPLELIEREKYPANYIPYNKIMDENMSKYYNTKASLCTELDGNEMSRLFNRYDSTNTGIFRKDDIQMIFFDIYLFQVFLKMWILKKRSTIRRYSSLRLRTPS